MTVLVAVLIGSFFGTICMHGVFHNSSRGMINGSFCGLRSCWHPSRIFPAFSKNLSHWTRNMLQSIDQLFSITFPDADGLLFTAHQHVPGQRVLLYLVIFVVTSLALGLAIVEGVCYYVYGKHALSSGQCYEVPSEFHENEFQHLFHILLRCLNTPHVSGRWVKGRKRVHALRPIRSRRTHPVNKSRKVCKTESGQLSGSPSIDLHHTCCFSRGVSSSFP